MKPGTPEHGTMEYGTTAEQRNTDRKPERWWNTRTMTEKRNAGGTPKHWQNNGTVLEQSEYHEIVYHEKSSRIIK